MCALAASLDQSRFRSLVGLFRSGWLKDQCERRCVFTLVLPDQGFLHWKWMVECLRVVKRERVDVIQAHEFDAIVHGWVVAKLAGIPLVATIHGKNYFWEKARRRWAYRWISRSATFVAVSDDLKRFVVEKTGIAETRIRIIHNGIALPPVPHQSEIEVCRAEVGLMVGAPVIGSVGSLYPVKGHRYLIEAMPLVLAQHPAAQLILVGRGDQEAVLKERVTQLGLESHVRFLGLRPDVPKLLALMDVFVLPSLSEGLSIALLEAMLAEKAVVATKVGGNAEVIQPGRTGWLVPAQDVDALAAALCEALSDRSRLERFGAAGSARARSEFGLERMTGQYEALYQAVS